MQLAKIIAVLGMLVMTTAIIFGFVSGGNFFDEGFKIVSMPWGLATVFDLYTGLTLFSAWVIYREKSLLVAILWAIALLVLGFVVGCLYIFLALQNSGGDWRKFWMGYRA
jgi:hypothetical protein